MEQAGLRYCSNDRADQSKNCNTYDKNQTARRKGHELNKDLPFKAKDYTRKRENSKIIIIRD